MNEKTGITRRDFIKIGTLSIGALAFGSGFMGCKPKEAGKPGESLKIIHATDTHLDLGMPETVQWLESFVEKVNQDFSDVDFVLFGGDNFNNNAAGNEDAMKFKSIADSLKCSWYSVRGNKESTPKPPGDPLGQGDFAKMFFNSELEVTGRDWKIVKGKYTILGIDSTIEKKNNGKFSRESLSFIENELKANPDQKYILLDHHPYENYWGGKSESDIHKYVLNNSKIIKKNIFKHKNLLLTLSGHKHLDYVQKEGGVTKIATLGFVVTQNIDKKDDHCFRYIEINGNSITERIAGIV